MRDNTSRGGWRAPRGSARRGRRLAAVAVALVVGFGLVGCKDETRKEEAPVATPTKEIVPSGALEKLAVPPDVLVYGGADSPTATLKKLSSLVATVSGGAAPPDMAAMGLKAALKLTDQGALDLSKPLRFAIVDPKANPGPMLLAFGTSGRAKLEAALPPDKKKDDGGNAWSYPAGTKTAYVNFIDDFAVLTYSKELFAKQRGFVKQLLGSKATGEAAAVVSIKNVTALFKLELDQFLAQVKTQIAAEAARQGGMPGTSPEQIAAVMEGVVGFVRDLDQLTVTAGAPDGGLRVTFDALPLAASETAKLVGSFKPGKLGLLAKLPANAPFAVAASMDPDADSETMRRLVNWALKLSLDSGEAQTKYLEAMKVFWKATNGELGYFAYRAEPSADLSLVGLTGLRDAAAAKKAWGEMVEIYKDKAVKARLEQQGFEVDFRRDAYKVGDVPVTVTEMKLGKALKEKPEIARMTGLLEGLMTNHSAITKDAIVVVMGKDAKKTITAWIEGKIPGGLDQAPGMARARQQAAAGAFALAYGLPLEVLRALPLGGANPFVDKLPPTAATANGLALSFGTSAGAAEVVIDLPADQIAAILQLVTVAKAGMR